MVSNCLVSFEVVVWLLYKPIVCNVWLIPAKFNFRGKNRHTPFRLSPLVFENYSASRFHVQFPPTLLVHCWQRVDTELTKGWSKTGLIRSLLDSLKTVLLSSEGPLNFNFSDPFVMTRIPVWEIFSRLRSNHYRKPL